MRRRRPTSEAEAPGSEASLEIAAHFLGTRPRSRWEIERRLRRARASDEVIQGTLEHLVKLGLVDDLAFARWWLEQRDRHAPRGQRMVEAELRQHGVGRDVIERLRDEVKALEGEAGQRAGEAELDMPSSEEARARVALQQHLRGRPLPDDRKALQRLGMYLMRRGFDPDSVRSALRPAGPEDEDPGE